MFKRKRTWTPSFKRAAKKQRVSKGEIVSAVRRYAEHKAVFNVDSDQAVDFNSDVVLLNGLANGNDDETRVGKRISLSNINVKFWCRQAAAATTPCCINAMILYDNQADGALATASDIFENTGVVAAPVSQINWQHEKRFKVLARFTRTLGIVSGSEASWAHEFNIPMKGKIVEYQGTGGTIASILKGAILLVVTGSTNANNPTYDFNSRVTYTDV